MKKIFFLIPTLDGGGAEKVLVDLVNNLNKDKFEITVKTLLGGGVHENGLMPNITYRTVIKSKNKHIRKILFYMLAFILPGKLSYRMIVKEKYDVEVSYLEGVTTQIMATSNNHTAKKFAFVHIDFSSNYALAKVYNTVGDCLRSYQLFDQVVFVSNKAKSGFEEVIGALPSSIVLRNVLDEKTIIKLSQDEVKEERNGKFSFVSVGRLCNQKGYDRLLQAAVKLNGEQFDFNILIIGEGTERQSLQDLMIKHHIHNVKLLGFKENPYQYIRACDMFICSSRAEGYSTVVSESLILGVPVLTTDCAGMDEILDHGKYGLVVENSIEGIYAGMKRILQNPGEHEKYRLLAKERSRYFSAKENIKAYEALFENGRTK